MTYHLAARQSVSMKIFLNKFVVIMAGEDIEHSNKLLHIKKSYNINNLLDAKSRNMPNIHHYAHQLQSNTFQTTTVF